MNRVRWEHWRSAAGQVKDSILSELMADNEPLVEKFASEFLKRTRMHTEPLVDDIFQAARIGLMRAMHAWDPEKGAFSTIAFMFIRKEMQNVIRHAKPVSVTMCAYLPRAKQDAAARFYAQHGREPEPAEIGVSASDALLAERANATYVPVDDDFPSEKPNTTPTPEEDLDRARDVRALQTFLGRYEPKVVKAFWAGKRPDLEAAARAYVEQRRVTR